MNPPRHLTLLAWVLLLLSGCSSESTNPSAGGGGSAGNDGGGGSGGSAVVPAACTAMCDAIDSAKCTNESQLICIEVCKTTSIDCPALSDDFATCVASHKTEITCDTDGKGVFIGCETQFIKVIPCSVCIIKPTDSPGDKCLKEKCCGEMKDAYSQADFVDYSDCVAACQNQDTCVNNCGVQFPTTSKKFGAIESCRVSSCAGG